MTTAAAASGRLGVAAAPGGLRLVQDLVNSAAIRAFDVPDLLADGASARSWLEYALAGWSSQTSEPAPELDLRSSHLVHLRDGRDRARRWLNHRDVDLPASRVVLRSLGERLVIQPEEDGARGVLALVVAELMLAERDGSARRLKTCANPVCGAAFYDLSRNSSRVWHDVTTCGNVTNLRASRARRRAAGN